MTIRRNSTTDRLAVCLLLAAKKINCNLCQKDGKNWPFVEQIGGFVQSREPSVELKRLVSLYRPPESVFITVNCVLKIAIVYGISHSRQLIGEEIID